MRKRPQKVQNSSLERMVSIRRSSGPPGINPIDYQYLIPRPGELLRLVIATTEVLLQPAIESDEQVAAAHLLDLEFRLAGATVTPSNRNHRPGIFPHDGLQR